MNARMPAEVFPPGEFLADELEERGWSQVELAEILGRPPRLINEIIAGKRAITPETALGLGAALGPSPEFWMNLESAYQLSKARIEQPEVSKRARLYDKFPVKEMLKRGWIEFSENIEVLEQRFLDFFGLPSAEDDLEAAFAARMSSYAGPPSKLQVAWYCRASLVAQAVRVAKYSDKALREAIPQLRQCMAYKEEIAKVPDILAKAGVKLVIVETLARLKMDACCFWVNEGATPVIALSLRYDRIDNFWFNLFHEIDHILHGEGKDSPIYDNFDATGDRKPPHEERANANAANYCIPKTELDGFIARVSPMFSKQAIVGFARRLNVHPGIVVGQLHGRGVIHFSTNREMLEKIRDVAANSILTDGFGNALPI
jgi:HTH-type transcriptional regulator/antitoxin HigA